MQTMSRAWVEIDPAALSHNLQLVKELAPSAKVMAVIKANAYGHGLAIAARALRLADEFAVTDVIEALELRAIDANTIITTLSADFNSLELDAIDGKNIRPVVFNLQQVQALQQAQLTTQLDIWIKVDTGMGRLGFMPSQVAEVIKQLADTDCVSSLSLMTHLANADDIAHESNDQQLDAIGELEEIYDWREISVLNSAGILSRLGMRQQMIRPGLMLYGVSPMLKSSKQQSKLKPSMNFKARVISVKSVAANTSIGYGSRYVTNKQTKIATISCGYADGYPRHAPNGTPVIINGYKVPLVGRVSMDMITVDIQDLPILIGDIAILWGEQNSLETVAQMSATIAYDLLVGIMPRVQRMLTS